MGGLNCLVWLVRVVGVIMVEDKHMSTWEEVETVLLGITLFGYLGYISMRLMI